LYVKDNAVFVSLGVILLGHAEIMDPGETSANRFDFINGNPLVRAPYV
jgi:hypothetical protein